MAAPGHDAVVLDERAVDAYLEAIKPALTSKGSLKPRTSVVIGLAGLIDQGWRLVPPEVVDELWVHVGALRAIQRSAGAEAAARSLLNELERLLTAIVKGHDRRA